MEGMGLWDVLLWVGVAVLLLGVVMEGEILLDKLEKQLERFFVWLFNG